MDENLLAGQMEQVASFWSLRRLRIASTISVLMVVAAAFMFANQVTHRPEVFGEFASPNDLLTAANWINKTGNGAVDVCEDPFEFSCGGFNKNFVLPKGIGVFTSGFSTVEMKLKDQIDRVLRAQTCEVARETDKWGALLACAYELCQANDGYGEGLGVKTFPSEIKDILIRAAPILSYSPDERLIGSLSKENRSSYALDLRDLSSQGLISLASDVDSHYKSGKMVISVKGSKTFFQNPQSYKEKADYEALTDYLISLFKGQAFAMGFKIDMSAISDRVEKVISLDEGLAKLRVADSDHPGNTCLPLTSEELNDVVFSIFDQTQLKLRFPDLYRAVMDTGDMPRATIISKSLHTDTLAVIASWPDYVALDWFMLRAMDALALSLPSGSGAKKAALMWRNHTEGDQALDTAGQCYDWALNNLQYPLSKSLLLSMPDERREALRTVADQMVGNVKSWLHDNVESAWWSDAVAKEAMLYKISTMRYTTGWPEWLLDPIKSDEELTRMYTNSNHPSDYFHNSGSAQWLNLNLVLRQSRSLHTDGMYGTTATLDHWQVYPHEVNADYDPAKNAFSLPIGALQPPLLFLWGPHGTKEDVENQLFSYGALGSVIGHEMTHGFDNTGRRYDGDGQLEGWGRITSTRKSDQSFSKIQDCIAHQYSQFSYRGIGGRVIQVDGSRCEGENLADNGAMQVISSAIIRGKLSTVSRSMLKSITNVDSAKLPTSVLPAIAFASVWCEKATEEFRDSYLQTNVHSPGDARAKGTLRNLKVAATTSCPAGTEWNPHNWEGRCFIWESF